MMHGQQNVKLSDNSRCLVQRWPLTNWSLYM